MITTDLIYNAYMANADSVISLQILGKGIYLLHMVGEDLPQKMNSYAVMKRLSVDSENWEDEQLETFEAHECSDHAASIVPELDDDWEETESDDGHRELYEDLDINERE